ncbi:MAG: HD-GYP domain-containing protein [Lachnospiraceae bacterium]|nr:HD-GYP domain-containing protein [Lachnospiraceae bacterium]MBP5250545.1 HD-GYP domain-containing protein [Lachnospiraceae bacterium]
MKTKRVPISNVKPGMMLAEDVYNTSDQLVLNKGTELTDRSITRLKFYSIREVVISIEAPASEGSQDATAPENINTYTKRLKKSADYKVFATSFKDTVNVLEARLKSFVESKNDLNADELLGSTKKTFFSVESTGKIFDMLMCIRNLDDLTFVHSTNVSLICGAFGQWLGYNGKDIDQLMLAGLLHDIGKLMVPESILKKKGALTKDEYEIIKGHPKAGYDMLKNQNLDDKVALVALQHHERTDGSGYPSGLKSHHIEDFSKIVAIADVYDAMTAARCYRGPICPLEVLNMFETEGLTKYDPKFLLVFMDHVVSTYLHQYVLLSNGNVGEIVMINKHSPARPIIKLLSSECVDLSKVTGTTIVGLV